jgi:predicted nucleotidyltransferase
MDTQQAVEFFNKHEALEREILRCEVGSTAHGVGLPGNDDFDMLAIGIEKPEYVLGTKSFETAQIRTAEIREGKKGVPSQPGDIDLTIHSLRKFVKLAAQGNPSVILMLYSPVMKMDDFGRVLRMHHHLFASKDVGRRFLGYMEAQLQRLKGERGQMRTTRQTLIDEYGFDTKYAMHVLRLGYQGKEFLNTGEIECPIAGPMANFLIGVRRGRQTFETVCQLAAQYENDIKVKLGTTHLPDHADYDAIDQLMVGLYQDAWTGRSPSESYET